MDIRAKSAFVTGAGNGIGRAMALMLAERGASHVIVADLDGDAVEETARLVSAHGSIAKPIRLDVTDHAMLETAIDECDRTSGLDILINNAGILSGFPAFPDMSIRRIETVIAVNLTAMIAGSKFAINRMSARGKGGAIKIGRAHV